MSFLDQYLQINQTISGNKAYAIDCDWYNQFLQYFDNLLSNECSSLESLRNYSICIVSEETNQSESLRHQLQNNFYINPKLILLRQDEQILKKDKYVGTHYVLVNEEIWNLIINTFSGGPCIPLYSMSKEESRMAKLMKPFKFISYSEQSNIENFLCFPTENDIVNFVIQKSDENLISLQIVVPLAFSINQIYEKILQSHLVPDIEYDIFDPIKFRWIGLKACIQLQELKTRELWILFGDMQQKQKHCFEDPQQDQQQHSSNFQEELDEHQMSQDFQQLRQDGKTRSTEPTTESRDVESLLDTLEIDPDVEHRYEHLHISNDTNLELKNIDEFRQDIHNMVEGEKYQLIIKKKYKVIENITNIVQQIEMQLNQCLKVEQKEEKTDDEIQETDI